MVCQLYLPCNVLQKSNKRRKNIVIHLNNGSIIFFFLLLRIYKYHHKISSLTGIPKGKKKKIRSHSSSPLAQPAGHTICRSPLYYSIQPEVWRAEEMKEKNMSSHQNNYKDFETGTDQWNNIKTNEFHQYHGGPLDVRLEILRMGTTSIGIIYIYF